MPIIEPLTAIDELITQIYQGPLESRPWQTFLRRLRERLDCDSAIIWLRPAESGVMPLTLWDSSRPPYNEGEGREASMLHGRLAHLDLLSQALHHTGDIFTLEEVLPSAELHKSDFYLKLLQPTGTEYVLTMYLEPLPGWKCHLGLTNGPNKMNFGAGEKKFLLALGPHLENALKLYSAIKQNESKKDIYGGALDRLTIGAIILDGQGNVIETNTIARGLIRDNPNIALRNGRLVFERKKYNTEMTRILDTALAWQDRHHQGGYMDALRIEADDNTSLGLLVRTVPPLPWYQIPTSPRVIIYIGSIESRQHAQEQFVARLFGLTHSEASVATLIANGSTLVEAAEKLNLTESTVRTYSKTIYVKLGVNGQTDLVRLILKSVALLADEAEPAAAHDPDEPSVASGFR